MKKVITLLIAVLIRAIWLVANPPGRFGYCRYAFTVYGAIPHPISDLQIRADGTSRKVAKTHELSLENVEWLLTSKPDVLIVALGWDGVTVPADEIREHKVCEVHLLKNKEAIALFNRLKRSGKRVAIHYHSTC